MAEESDELRQQIDSQRAEISGTVEQIENRVRPSRIAARRTARVRDRMTSWRDAVFGGSDGPGQYGGDGRSEGGLADRASDMTSSAVETVRHGPEVARRQAQGNPLAAGAIALGAGWLVAGLMPGSREERKLVERAEPKLAEVASSAKAEGESLAEELREPAKEAAEQVQDSAKSAAQRTAHSSSGSS